MAQSANSIAAKSSLSVMAAFICVAITIVLLAGTIVLSLIPIYTSQRSITIGSTLSNEFRAYHEIGLASGRRKRQASPATDVNSLYGATVSDTSSVAAVKNVYKNKLVGSQYIADITDPVCTITGIPSGKRKRYTLFKRQTTIHLFACRMRLIFKHGMSDFEKNSRGPKIQQTLVQRFQGIFAWPTLIFNLNGVQLSFTPINIGFYYASTIGAPGGNNDDKNTLATISTTSTTTTSYASANIG